MAIDTKNGFPYKYVAQNSRGEKVKGEIYATSDDKAYSTLRSKGLMPLDVNRADAGLQMDITIPGFKSRAKLKSKAVWAKQFATLIESGMPLIKALQVSAEQTQDKALQKALEEVYKEVDKGSSLAYAMEQQSETFPPLIVSLVRVGESGGFLPKTLKAIGENLKSEVELRGRIKAALVYPAIVGVISIIAVAVMLIFIVPIFVDMFTGMGAELPAITQMLVTLSENMIWIVPLLLTITVVLFFLYRHNKDKLGFRKVADPIKLKIPIFGKIIQKIVVARFSRNLAMMVNSGVPLMNALELVGSTANSYPIEEAVQHATTELQRGKTLAEPLSDYPDLFPAMLTAMVSVGEETGALDKMLDNVADFYEDEVKVATEGLSATIEPIMIVVLGVLIGGMVIALYMPMFSIFSEMSEM